MTNLKVRASLNQEIQNIVTKVNFLRENLAVYFYLFSIPQLVQSIAKHKY